MTTAIERALNPRSIAVVGASERPESRGFHLWRAAARAAQGIALHPVNPKYRYVGEHRAYASTAEVPGPVDLAVLALPQRRVAEALDKMDASKVGAVLIAPEDDNLFVDGLTARAVADAARAKGLRLIGPDSIGIALPHKGVNASFWVEMPPEGNIALITQSGMIASALVERILETNAGFSAVVNSGAEMDLGMPDWLEHFSRDVKTRVIAIQVEAIREPARFWSALRAAAMRKPVVVLRAGAPEGHVPERLAALRFGTDAGRRESFAALVRQAGAHLVTRFADFAAAAAAFSIGRLPQGEGTRTAILTNGSGFAAMAADDAAAAGLTLPGLSSDVVQTFREKWPGEQMPVNPVILGAGSSEARYRETLEALLGDPGLDAVLTIAAPNPALDFDAVVREVALAAQTSVKPVGLAWVSGQRSAAVKRILAEKPDARVCAVRSPDDAARALGLLAQQTQLVRARRLPPAGPRPRLGRERTEALRRMVEEALAARRHALTGNERARFFSLLGVRSVATERAPDADDAVRAALDLGFPVVLKADAPGLARKAELGLVELTLFAPEDVRTAFERLRGAYEAIENLPLWTGVVVEKMHPHMPERELRFAIVRDHVWGPTLEFGQGGLSGELHPEFAAALPPVSLDVARQTVRRPAVARTFGGFRGMPPVDTDRAAELLCHLSDVAAAIPAIREIRIDPLVPEPDGFLALDAGVWLWDGPVRPEPNHPHLTLGAPPETAGDDVFTAKDGTRYRARPVEEDDFPRVFEFISGLSEKSFFLRFHSSARLSEERVAALCRIDYRRAVAWADVCGDGAGGERIACLGRVSLADPAECPDEAEFGVVVADRDQRRGLATRMMARLEDEALRLGAKAIFGIVLRGNDGMSAMMEKLGYVRASDERDTIRWRKILR